MPIYGTHLSRRGIQLNALTIRMYADTCIEERSERNYPRVTTNKFLYSAIPSARCAHSNASVESPFYLAFGPGN